MVLLIFVPKIGVPKISTKMNFVGFRSESYLFVKGRSKMQNEHRSIACWKDILQYLDTYHLILHIGIENEKVGRGGKCRKAPWKKT